MPSNRVVTVRAGADSVEARRLADGIAAIQAELEVTPEFPPEVERAAAQAATAPRVPDLDLTQLPFVTIDPPSARDLDQALHLERHPDLAGGYLVHYAIADVAAFVEAGDPVDVEAHRRGETLYGADSKVPLHPKVLSEDAASLLPDQVRPALVWRIGVDADGEPVGVALERALVRSRAKLDYAGVQQQLDAGTADEVFTLLREVGQLRQAREAARGGISLPLPEQEISLEDGRASLAFRRLHPVEEWNAQTSLLTGMAAASLMLEGKVGLVRTLPPADPRDVARLHRTAAGLDIAWPDDQPYPDFIRTLDPTRPSHAAMVVACTRLLRGSGYAGFDGELPEQPRHSALAAEYAHVTAPLRRLVDRYALEACHALTAGTEVPDWVLARLDELPGTMQRSGQRANRYENAVLDLVEAEVLAARLGERFTGVVVDLDHDDPTRGEITVQDPAIEADVVGAEPLPLGERVTVELTTADPDTRRVEFTRQGSGRAGV